MSLPRLGDRFVTAGLSVLATWGFVARLDLGQEQIPAARWFAFGLGLGLTTIGLGISLGLRRSTGRR